jgi:hypothetical protein
MAFPCNECNRYLSTGNRENLQFVERIMSNKNFFYDESKDNQFIISVYMVV